MSRPDDLGDEMADRLLLDRDTEDRLLAGRIHPDDAPPGCGEVAAFARALAANLPTTERTREEETVRAMVRLIGETSAVTPHRASPRRRPTGKLCALVIAASMLGTTGAAFAGGLPGPAQDFAARILRSVGLHVPGSTQADTNSRPRLTAPRSTPTRTPASSLTGRQRRGALAGKVTHHPARAGASRHHHAGAGDRSDGMGSGSTTLPDAAIGGPPTADDGRGQADDGTTTADTESQGRSTAGSGNATPPDDLTEPVAPSGGPPPQPEPSTAPTHSSPPPHP